MITSTATSALLALSTLTTFTFALPTLPNSFFDERSFEDAPLDFRQFSKRDTATTNDYQGVDSGNQLLYFPSFERPTKGEVFQAGGNLRIAWYVLVPYDRHVKKLRELRARRDGPCLAKQEVVEVGACGRVWSRARPVCWTRRLRLLVGFCRNTTKPYDWNEDQLPKYAEVRLGYLDPNDPGYHLDAGSSFSFSLAPVMPGTRRLTHLSICSPSPW